MGNYRELESCFRNIKNAKLLILDTGNIQFYFQHSDVLPQTHIFKRFDLVLIPGWVHAEYAHHAGKVRYIASIPVPCVILDEVDDYLPLLKYSDKKLMELFRIAAPFAEAQQFFNAYRRKEVEEWPDDWIEQFYQNGFPTRHTGALITKKNAGETSILALCFALLSHYCSRISNIAIASSDFGIIKIKNKLLSEANRAPLELGIPISPKISYMSKDVSLFIAVKEGIIQPYQLTALRPNSSSSIYIELFPNKTSTLHQHVLETSDFETICANHQRYSMIF